MKIVNCTPHPITVRLNEEEEEERNYPASGVIPRVQTIQASATPVNGVPTVTQTLGEVEGLPEPQAGTYYIVSAMVLSASSRTDLLAPDTGKTCIRDEKGRITAVTRFIRN